jgi:hypothetical protein
LLAFIFFGIGGGSRAFKVGSFIAFALIMTVGVLIIPIIRSAQAWRTTPGLRHERRFTFSDSGSEVSWDTSEVTRAWTEIRAVIEQGDFYSLRVRSPRGFLLLPKRGFDSTADEAAFRELAARYTRFRGRRTSPNNAR